MLLRSLEDWLIICDDEVTTGGQKRAQNMLAWVGDSSHISSHLHSKNGIFEFIMGRRWGIQADQSARQASGKDGLLVKIPKFPLSVMEML